MNCKNCVREKYCKRKNDIKGKCPFYIDYSESEKYRKLDLLIRTNKGIQF
jgi:hypothetical protein